MLFTGSTYYQPGSPFPASSLSPLLHFGGKYCTFYTFDNLSYLLLCKSHPASEPLLQYTVYTYRAC